MLVGFTDIYGANFSQNRQKFFNNFNEKSGGVNTEQNWAY